LLIEVSNTYRLRNILLFFINHYINVLLQGHNDLTTFEINKGNSAIVVITISNRFSVFVQIAHL